MHSFLVCISQLRSIDGLQSFPQVSDKYILDLNLEKECFFSYWTLLKKKKTKSKATLLLSQSFLFATFCVIRSVPRLKPFPGGKPEHRHCLSPLLECGAGVKKICLSVTVIEQKLMSVRVGFFFFLFQRCEFNEVWEPVKLFSVVGVLGPATLLPCKGSICQLQRGLWSWATFDFYLTQGTSSADSIAWRRWMFVLIFECIF